eukprot:TRINITY_DN73484_c0_g1_i1.p1 TRINITY_DN73484_c0_g1~~TRINITY_DN73484_c0_g1_i1.p1  ORF type:complete len:308 (-),score=28.66 TRINITY_DN73484_c0_g1_i1:42-965(-)
MKLNIANPARGTEKCVEIDDERKLRIFYDKTIGAEVEVDALGDEFKGYVMRITGGNDKQGFPMMQGVLIRHRVKLLLSKRHMCYRPRRDGERRRKSVRGAIVGPDLAALNMIIVTQGDNDLPGLTDETRPKPRGPIRASKIRKMFNLSPEDDVMEYAQAIRGYRTTKGGKKIYKPLRVQRLMTPTTVYHKNLRRRKTILQRKRFRAQRELYLSAVKEKSLESAKIAAEKLHHRAEKLGTREAISIARGHTTFLKMPLQTRYLEKIQNPEDQILNPADAKLRQNEKKPAGKPAKGSGSSAGKRKGKKT